uniref:Uncharacterized protein n=1 Tax=Rhizophora mucronata TaxID=61149 RepID=A0A2P2QAY5_RHIMU
MFFFFFQKLLNFFLKYLHNNFLPQKI